MVTIRCDSVLETVEWNRTWTMEVKRAQVMGVGFQVATVRNPNPAVRLSHRPSPRLSGSAFLEPTWPHVPPHLLSMGGELAFSVFVRFTDTAVILHCPRANCNELNGMRAIFARPFSTRHRLQ